MRRRTLAATLAIGMAGMVFTTPIQAVAGTSGTTPAGGQPRATEAKIVPLQAVEQITRTAAGVDGKQVTRETNRLYRDDQGRIRHESGSLVTITDPVAGTTVRLDFGTGTYTSSASGQRPSGDPAASGPTVKQQQLSSAPRSLGTATMAGVLVEGTAHTVTIPRTNAEPITKEVTNWLSRDLKLAVQTRIVEATGAEYVRTYTDIQAAVAPPAELFTVPAGYRAADSVTPTALPCPVSAAPNPLFLDSFGWFLGAGIQRGQTDYPTFGCVITYTEAGVQYPLWAVGESTGIDSFEWLFYDTGGPLPWVPWIAFGYSCYQAANAEFITSACGDVQLIVWE
jgi:hypothetical protein